MPEPRPTPVHRIRTRLRSVPKALWLLLLVGALQSIAWDIALPAFQGPDESAHYDYIQYLAETGSLPSATSGRSPNSSETSSALNDLNLSSLIGNFDSRPAWSSADLSYWHQAEQNLARGARSDGDGPNPIAKNPPLYYAAMSIPYRLVVWLPLLKRLFFLRLFNSLCFLATIGLTWMIAGDLFGRVRWKQTLTAGVVALEPQLAFMSAVINADSLLVTLTTALLLVALRLVRRGPTLGRVLAASSLSAAAVLTHGRGLVTLPVLCIALFVAWIRHRPAVRDTVVRAGAAAATLGAAVVTYVLFVRSSGSGSLYGGQVTLLNSGTFNLRQFLSSIFQFYFGRFRSLQPPLGPPYGYRQVFIETFYGTFGSLEVAFRQRVYDVLQVGSALGLVGFYTACVVRRRLLIRAWPCVVVLLSLLVCQLFFLHYVSYRALLGNGGTDPLIVGRYLLPMVSLFGLAITFTVASLPRRTGPMLGAVVLSIGLILALGGIGITAARFYG